MIGKKHVLEPEVATQSGYSIVGLLHLYHDYVLYKSTASAGPATLSEQYVGGMERVVCELC